MSSLLGLKGDIKLTSLTIVIILSLTLFSTTVRGVSSTTSFITRAPTQLQQSIKPLFKTFLSATMSTSSNNTTKREPNIAVHWFRNGLRLHDNPSLSKACQSSSNHDYLLPLYIINPQAPFAQTPNRKAGTIRANFILESITEFNKKLKTMDSRLLVVVGEPEVVLPKLLHQIGATALYYEREPAEPIRNSDATVLHEIQQYYSAQKDESEDDEGNNKHPQIVGFDTHTLFPMEHYISKCKNHVAPSTYGVFTKTFSMLGNVPSEIVTIDTVPPLPPNLNELNLVDDEDGEDGDTTTTTTDTQCTFECPTLQDLGYDETDLKNRCKGGYEFKGGEDAGLELLKTMMKRTSWVSTFEKPKTSPNALSVDTTGLSPYIKHGCVSPRRFYHELSTVYAKFPSNKLSKPPVSLHGQLMWREYNYLMGYTTPNFDAMVENPIVRQIPWDDDPKLRELWVNGQTGYPFIDAIMTQLKETGWIHHLARHAVACFLTRGDLWQSWEYGAEVFEERLIDADWSINNFNWQWLSCSAHFYQYFRCYSPVAFGKKTDPNGDYIRKWLPKLKNLPKKYIYEPWTAPLSVQQGCGVIIGKDYPEPIVDHKVISKSNMARMKEAYDAAKAAAAVQASTTTSSSSTSSSKSRSRTAKQGTSNRKRSKQS